MIKRKLKKTILSIQNWSKDEDEENPEMYCHFSGEFSPGETSYSKPILKKHWKKAKEVHNL
jgi:hypothetical protein